MTGVQTCALPIYGVACDVGRHGIGVLSRRTAEVVGYGASGDAFHMAAPQESGQGMSQAMRSALRDAEIAAEQISFVNAHGTSTKLNDGERLERRVYLNSLYDFYFLV